MRVEQANDAATCTIYVNASIRDVQCSITKLRARPLRVPCNASFPFPLLCGVALEGRVGRTQTR